MRLIDESDLVRSLDALREHWGVTVTKPVLHTASKKSSIALCVVYFFIAYEEAREEAKATKKEIDLEQVQCHSHTGRRLSAFCTCEREKINTDPFAPTQIATNDDAESRSEAERVRHTKRHTTVHQRQPTAHAGFGWQRAIQLRS